MRKREIEQKDLIEIVNQLRLFVNQKTSARKASASLKGVSQGVISHLLSGNWEPYSDDMFRKIGAQLGFNSKEWQFADTTNSTDILENLADAKQNSLVLSFIGHAGAGKSATTKKFASENKNVFRIECGQYWDRNYFLSEILSQMGVKDVEPKISYMMRDIVSGLKKLDKPQLIIDEVDKLDDKVLLFLITFYNELATHCSIIILATHFLKKRIDDGIRLRKKGYEEIKSRYGSYIELEDTSAKDVKLICEANGLDDNRSINTISANSRGDLRKVYNAVIASRIDEKRKITA